jgi:hypothetical protein
MYPERWTRRDIRARRSGTYFPSSHSKRPPLSIDDCRSMPAARRAMHECRTHSTTSFPAIIPAHDHESWPSRSTMEFETTMPGFRISLEEHYAVPTQEDCQHLDTPMEALFTAAACTCNSPIGFQTAILSSETIAVGNPTTKLLPPPPSYKQVSRCRTISRPFSTRYWISMPQLRHLLHPCWCRREVHFPVQSVLTILWKSCQRMRSRRTDVLK